jgi:hypothetical protein
MSSIFEDNELIKKLIEAELNQIKRLAQAAPAPNIAPDPNSPTPGQIYGSNYNLETYRLAKKMALQLQRKIDPQKAKEAKEKFNPIFAPGEESLNPTFKEVKSLGDFLNWIKSKQITFDGKKIVYTDQEAQGKTGLYNFNTPDLDITTPKGRLNQPVRDEATGNVYQKGLFVDKDALVGFISYLINNYSETPLGIPLRTLIDELNEKLPEGQKVSKEPKKEEVATDTLDPSVPIDTFSNNIIVKTPLALTAPQDAPFFRGADKRTQLFLNNISSTDNFIGWLQGKKIDRDGQLFPAEDRNNICETVNLLYLRSQALSTYSTPLVKNYNQYIKKYQDAVFNLGKQFSCAITSPGAAEPGKGGATGQTGKLDQQSIQNILTKVCSLLPLNRENINLLRIENFLKMVAQLNDDKINSIINDTNSYIQIVKRDLTGSGIIQLPESSSTISTFKTYFKPQSQMPNNYAEHLGYLNQIVQKTADIVNILRYNYRDKVSEDQAKALDDQVLYHGPGNARNLKDLTSDLSSESKK